MPALHVYLLIGRVIPHRSAVVLASDPAAAAQSGGIGEWECFDLTTLLPTLIPAPAGACLGYLDQPPEPRLLSELRLAAASASRPADQGLLLDLGETGRGPHGGGA